MSSGGGSLAGSNPKNSSGLKRAAAWRIASFSGGSPETPKQFADWLPETSW
jgi:hypothetical protein